MQLDLSTFDAQLLDGLDFCHKVYDFFDQVRSEPDGIEKLRLRLKEAKKLIEELIPIAHYIQARYREGRRIKVRWLSGSQPHDAIFCATGWLVENEMYPKEFYIEVTTSVHQNEYLVRELINEGSVAFSPKGTSRDKKSREIISKPYAHTNNEGATDLAIQIIERLKSKSAKHYAQGTVLIVSCVADGLIEPSEWDRAIDQVIEAQAHLGFREVFLLERIMCYSTTLYGKRCS